MVPDPYTTPDFASAALITIDTQGDVLDGGTLEVPGTSEALPGIRALAAAFRLARRPIVHAIRLYLPDGSNVDPCRRGTIQAGALTLVAGTAGSQLAPGLAPRADARLDEERLLKGEAQQLGHEEAVIYKPRWGAFFQTSLEDHLRERGVDTLIFAGCNFPNCPRTSIYEASERDFRVVLARDAISGIYERGARELRNIGVRLMTVEETVSALAAATEPGSAGKLGRTTAAPDA